MESATLEGKMWIDDRRPDPPHVRERELGYWLRCAESTAAGTPPPNSEKSTAAGAVGWLLYRLQELGIPAPASSAAA